MAVVYFLAVLVTFLYYYFTRTFNFWKKKGVVGPKPLPIFGNIIECALRKKNYAVNLKEVYDTFPDEKIVGLYRMTTPCLLIRDLDLVKHIMIKDFDFFHDRGVRFSDELLGQNLFNVDGDTWRILRAKFTPIFTSTKMKSMMPLMNERADNFLKYLENICVDNTEYELHSLLQKYTMANIGACTLGVNIDTQHDETMIENLKKIDEYVFDVNYSIEFDFMYPGILKTVNSSIFPSFVKTFVQDILKKALSQRNGQPSSRKDLLDLLLELRQLGVIHGHRKNSNNSQMTVELTDDVIISQAFVFFSAGYATSAVLISYMLYELSLHQEIQEKLVADIERGLKKHGGEVTLESLQDMTYLGQVFDETLRKYPLVDPLQRQAQTDYKLPGTDVTIPRGTYVLVSALGVQRDPKYYVDPEKFDPERFAPENFSKNQHPISYLSFGVGPRNCVGMRFAKTQSKVGIVKILSKFRVYPSKNTPKTIPICPKRAIAGPSKGLLLNLIRR